MRSARQSCPPFLKINASPPLQTFSLALLTESELAASQRSLLQPPLDLQLMISKAPVTKLSVRVLSLNSHKTQTQRHLQHHQLSVNGLLSVGRFLRQPRMISLPMPPIISKGLVQAIKSTMIPCQILFASQMSQQTSSDTLEQDARLWSILVSISSKSLLPNARIVSADCHLHPSSITGPHTGKRSSCCPESQRT